MDVVDKPFLVNIDLYIHVDEQSSTIRINFCFIFLSLFCKLKIERPDRDAKKLCAQTLRSAVQTITIVMITEVFLFLLLIFLFFLEERHSGKH